MIPTEIVVGRNCLDARSVLGAYSPGTVPIITHPGASAVAGRVARSVEGQGSRAEVLTVADGEGAKSLSVVEQAVGWLSGLGVRRDGIVVGVGGGSLTDLVGFVAGVYLRGVGAVYVPTTLLGAVDAAIGGKTGVNVDGKNVVGVFRHPKRVVIDIDVLDDLSEVLKRQGLAEALKAGLVGDPALFEMLELDLVDADLEEVVRRSIDVKLRVVGRDFEEAGERAHLNYGHTIGHAVESATGMSHGEAVAVGMVAAGRVSALTVGFTEEDRQRAVITALGLPVAAPGASRDRVLTHLARDKKRDRQGVRMVVLEAIGEPRVIHADGATVDAALESVGITGGRP